MPEFSIENDVNAKNSFYHFIFKKSIDWLIISGALYLVWSYISSKNLYFLAGKLLLMFCLVELIRRYFLTWTKLRKYYNTRDILRKHSIEEIPDKEEGIQAKTSDGDRASLQKYHFELNKLLMEAYEKDYKDLNDYYEHERAEFLALRLLWKEDPNNLHASFEGYLSLITAALNITEIPGDEKKNYKRISGMLVIVLLFIVFSYIEPSLLPGIL